MKLQYFLDTETIIYINNHRPPHVLEHFKSLKPGTVGISVITYGELIRGAERSQHKQQNHQKLKQLFDLIPVHSMPKNTGQHYGEIRSSLEKTGSVIGNNDRWIAAHAQAIGVTVVTNKTREFSRVETLNIENWV